jgi:hypothetical protein
MRRAHRRARRPGARWGDAGALDDGAIIADPLVDAAVDASTGPLPQADAADASATCPPVTPLTSADMDQSYGWKPALRIVGACSDGDIDQLRANIFSFAPVTSYFDLGAGLSQSCNDCVFSKDTDATWGLIVGHAANGGATGFLN